MNVQTCHNILLNLGSDESDKLQLNIIQLIKDIRQMGLRRSLYCILDC
jgi:hypothetical protein